MILFNTMYKVSVIMVVCIMVIFSCTQELEISGVANSDVPTAVFINPGQGSILNTNFMITYSVQDLHFSNVTAMLRIGTNISSVVVATGINQIEISNHPPGYYSLSLYVTNSWGLTSLTNVVEYTISRQGFTEIHKGSIQGISDSYILSDIDLDGDPDLILSGQTNTTYLGGDDFSGVYRNDGAGFFIPGGPTPIYPTASGFPVFQSSFCGDLDGDLYPDYVSTGRIDGLGGSNATKIYRNMSGNGFLEINSGMLTNVSAGLVVGGDIDGDNDLDLLVAGWVKTINSGSTVYDSTVLYRNDGNAGFVEISSITFPRFECPSAAFGDIDGDGDLDLALTGYNCDSKTPDSKIYRNNGSGSFSEINIGVIAGLYYPSIGFADMDGDGDLDLVISGLETMASNSRCIVYENNGSGSFSAGHPGALTGLSSVLGDIDGDGDVDIVVKEYSSGSCTLKIYFNQGGMLFTEQKLTSISNQGFNVVAGDIDGDGDLDLICNWLKDSCYYTSILRNDWNRGGYAPYTVISRSAY